jgi:hypothetical protein
VCESGGGRGVTCGGLTKIIMKYLGQDSQLMSYETSIGPPKYEGEVLTPQL